MSPKKSIDKENSQWYINLMGKISKMLKEIIEEKEKTTIRKVAKAVGVDHGSLYRALKDGGNPEGRTIEKILNYLGYDLKFIKRKDVKEVKSSLSKERKRR